VTPLSFHLFQTNILYLLSFRLRSKSIIFILFLVVTIYQVGVYVLYLTYDPRRQFLPTQYRRDYFETSPLYSIFRRSCHFIVVFLENKFLTLPRCSDPLPLLPVKKQEQSDHTALLHRILPTAGIPRYSLYL
jgi:hypothetical protein